MPVAGEVEKGAGRIVASQLSDEVLGSYLGHRFERVCLQWMLAESLAGRLPITASSFGQWWGADPGTRAQEEIDVVAADRLGKQALVGECKWRGRFDESEALEKLAHRVELLGRYEVEGLYLFSKNPPSNAMLSKMKLAGNQWSVCLLDLYEGRWRAYSSALYADGRGIWGIRGLWALGAPVSYTLHCCAFGRGACACGTLARSLRFGGKARIRDVGRISAGE